MSVYYERLLEHVRKEMVHGIEKGAAKKKDDLPKGYKPEKVPAGPTKIAIKERIETLLKSLDEMKWPE